ncbi:serine hydrolase [Winogradskyella ursingii]|uniref:serine hydrolase n=1 Tax=Winogradskyella ursingii TaxID=2686079 RepID=UPI0015CBD5D1|nr:serine hydrolase [Winogradskyella ursingii]
MKNLLQLFIILSTSQFVFAQDLTIPEDIKDHVVARVDQGFNPSIAMAYIKGDEVVYFNYGNTLLENGKPVNENTIYEIGSISKVFTTILLADEVSKGKMKLSDPISKYLPSSVKVPTKNGEVITLKHLATHSSGLPRMPNNFSPQDINNPFADYTVEQLYQFLSSYNLEQEIGSLYEYSNLGMGLLGHILELHTGKSYEELVIERIAKPLEMNDTQIAFTDRMKNRLAYGYNEELERTSNWDITSLAGAGAIRSSTSDMVKFIQANITDNDSSLNKAMKLSHEIAFTDAANNMNIGLGWHYANNDKIIWHNGGTGGYRAFSGFAKNTKEGVVVLTNSAFTADAIGLKVLGQDIKLQLPEKIDYPDIVDVDEKTLETYTGEYQLAPGFTLTIRRFGNQLTAQATGQSEFEIYATSKNEFFLKVVEASITFFANETGEIKSLTLHQGGRDMPAPKIE